MTMIAAFELDGQPVVLSDMLISLEDGALEGVRLHLPSSGPVSNLPSGRPVLHGLRQKLCVVAPNAVFAFAGTVGPAMIIAKALRNAVVDGRLTLEAFEKCRTGHLGRFEAVAIVGFIDDLTPEVGCSGIASHGA